MTRGRPPKTALTLPEHRRLLEVATRRTAGQSWSRIALDMGWGTKQAAQQWTDRMMKIMDASDIPDLVA